MIKRKAGFEKMVRSTSLSFGESKNSQKGIFSIFLGVISLLAGVVLVIISGYSRGNAPMAVGACGVVAIIASLIGVIYGIWGAKERDRDRMTAYVGFLLDLIITIAWACLFAIGLY